MNPSVSRRAAYLRLSRALADGTGDTLADADRELLLGLAEDCLASATAGACQAGGALLAGLVQAGRLGQGEASELWEELCACAVPGAWRPFASIMALAARHKLPAG